MHPGRARQPRIKPGRARDADRRARTHRHTQRSELYHVTAGAAWLYRDGQKCGCKPATPRALPPAACTGWTTPAQPSWPMLCCCAPAYAHADTELIDKASDV